MEARARPTADAPPPVVEEKEEGAACTVIEALPDDVLGLAFSFLESAEDLASAEATNRCWRRVVRDCHAWSRLACAGVDGLPYSSVRADPAVAKQLLRHTRLAVLGRGASLLAEALAASSTDNASEMVANTLSRRAKNKAWCVRRPDTPATPSRTIGTSPATGVAQGLRGRTQTSGCSTACAPPSRW